MKETKGNNTRLAVTITAFILLITLILDRLVPQGMFLDGITYASISRNVAIGHGSFWAPLFRSGVFFAEHPPMMFGMQSIFFNIFGDHYLTERIYCFAIWIVTVLLIRKVWNKTLHPSRYSYILPILLWSIIPTVIWAHTSNILDTTMALFDLVAMIIIYNALQKNGSSLIMGLLLGSIFICCAMLTKGPVGAFPIGIPVAYWLAYNNTDFKALAKHMLHSISLLLFVAITFIILYQFPEPRENFTRYLDEQLFSAMSGRREITGAGNGLGRFQMFYDLFMLLLVPLCIGLVIWIISKLIKKQAAITKYDNNKHFLFFLLLGLGASIPILISVKQRSFYLLPAMPYYIIALSILLYPRFNYVTNTLGLATKKLKTYKIIALIVCIGIAGYLGSKLNTIGRDKEMITEIHNMPDYLPQYRIVGVCNEMENEYSFLSYIQRYKRINVSGNFLGAPFVIVNNEYCDVEFTNSLLKSGYKLVQTSLVKHKIYRRGIYLNFDFIQLNPVFRTRGK